MEGWIKVYRKIQDHWIWKDPEYLKAWLTILFTVNHEEIKVLIHGDLIVCGRGQSVNSLQSWVKIFGKKWTVQKVRTFLNLLKSDAMINTEGLRKTTRITVCNYDSYQISQQTDNTQTTDSQQAANKQVTTNKNDKNEKNDKNKKEEEGEKSQKRFSPPTISELSEYITQERFSVNPETFFNFYESNGWFVGKTKMKDWRAAVRTWNSKEKQNKKSVHPAVEDISQKHYEKW